MFIWFLCLICEEFYGGWVNMEASLNLLYFPECIFYRFSGVSELLILVKSND